jgi:hypothetical protein|tara:strand:- start:67118 stop:67879 length:762 start_codon:yes stop_codon:yes gene_type:complete
MKKLLLFSTVLILSSTVYAQRNSNSNYWNTWEYTVKDGMHKEFEKAVAKKTSLYNKTPETAIRTYSVITGPNSGNYLRVEGNKSPKDYDLDRSAEGNYWLEYVSKYLVKEAGQVRYELLKEGSYNPNPNTVKFSKYVERTTFYVKADRILHFRRVMSRVAKVAEKRGWESTRSLYRLVNGGNRNSFVLAIGFDSYDRVEKPETETTFKEDYDELFGWGSLEEDWKNYDASLESWGEQVDMLKLIPEMSTGMMK